MAKVQTCIMIKMRGCKGWTTSLRLTGSSLTQLLIMTLIIAQVVKQCMLNFRFSGQVNFAYFRSVYDQLACYSFACFSFAYFSFASLFCLFLFCLFQFCSFFCLFLFCLFPFSYFCFAYFSSAYFPFACFCVAFSVLLVSVLLISVYFADFNSFMIPQHVQGR